MEFYMVWNTSTTNDFPNVARGLKIKILALNLFLWREWLSFSPAFGIFALPKAPPLSLSALLNREDDSELLKRFREMKATQWILSPA